MNIFPCLKFLPSTIVVYSVHARSAGTPQNHPMSYTRPKSRGPVNKQTFVQFIHANQHLNKHIPASPPVGGMRVVTFNIHYFRDLFDKKSTLQDILNDIRTMNADVYLFQEVHMDTSNLDRKAFDAGLSSLGYQWQHVKGVSGATLGQMIASKHPLTKLDSLDLGYKRMMVEAELALKNNDKVTLFAAHWQNADSNAREKQARLTLNHIAKKGGASMGKFVLGADFNAIYTGEAIQILTRNGWMKSSFDALQWPHPTVTCWSGRPIDFLWAGNEVNKHVLGSYIFYTLSSDHLPVIMDLNLQPDTNSSPGSSTIYWILGAFFVICACVGTIFLNRYKRNSTQQQR